MIAILLPSEDAARAVSTGLWRLTRPASVAVDDVTSGLAGWEVQQDGTALLLVDPEWTLPIHPGVVAQMKDAADASGSRAQLSALLEPLLTSKAAGLPLATAAIAKGGTLRMGDLLALINPTMWAPYVPPVRTAP